MKAVNKRLWRSAMASAVLLAAALPASAQDQYLHAHARAGLTYPNLDPNGPPQLQTVDHWALSPPFPSQTAQAEVSALGGIGSGSSRADFGSLGVYARASTLNAAGSAASAVMASLGSPMSSWRDSATIAGLAPFTLVDIRVDMVVDVAALSIVAGSNGNGVTVASLTLNAHGKSWCMAVSSSVAHGQCAAGTLPLLLGRNELSFVVQAYSGSTVGFGAQMTANASVSTYNQNLAFTSSALVDSMNSAHAYYTVLTPGATLNWASGHNYNLPAVPEPTTWAMLLAGLGVLGLRRRRAR